MTHTKKDKKYFIVILILIVLIDLVLILNANFHSYTVIFKDGDSLTPVLVKSNEKVSALENKKAYFLGWYLDEYAYDFDNKVTSDIVLVARYQNLEKHLVTFDSNGGTDVSPVEVLDNEHIEVPASPTRENYDFQGWLYDEEYYNFDTPVVASMTLVASWREVKETEKVYTITFDSKGGSFVEPLKVGYDEYAIKPDNPTREGYSFNGWYQNGKLFYWNFKLTSDVELEAKWTLKKIVKLTFDSALGEFVSPMNVYKGETAVLPTPVRKGYVFVGWYYRNTKYTNDKVINSSLKLKAKWITTDEAALKEAINSLGTFEITKGGTKVNPAYEGCVITNTNAEVLASIVRETVDKKITLKFNIKCGTVSKNTTATALIKASPYKYRVEDLTLKLVGTNLDGELFHLDGTKIANVLNGNLKLNEELNENLILVIHGDDLTKYILKKIT